MHAFHYHLLSFGVCYTCFPLLAARFTVRAHTIALLKRMRSFAFFHHWIVSHCVIRKKTKHRQVQRTKVKLALCIAAHLHSFCDRVSVDKCILCNTQFRWESHTFSLAWNDFNWNPKTVGTFNGKYLIYWCKSFILKRQSIFTSVLYNLVFCVSFDVPRAFHCCTHRNML